jgi:hypothetical protein
MTTDKAMSGGGPAGVVHEIRWSDVLPWWLLLRAAGAAFAPSVILLAAFGAVAVWAGWSIADQLGIPGGSRAAATDALLLPSAAPAATVADPAVLVPSRRALPWLGQLATRLPRTAGDIAALVAVPFQAAATARDMGGTLVRLGWFVLVWAIFGTAICRQVSLTLSGEEPPGLLGAVLYGSRKWLPAFNSVLFVLAGIALVSVPGAVLGLLMRADWGLAIAGVVWPLVLAGALVLAILAIGVVAGWPLMVACVGVERGDSFQAISTAFSYLYQRPLHVAFHAAVAVVVALPALAAAGLFTDATGGLAMWAASFGMGHGRTAEVLAGLGTGDANAPWGLRAIALWHRSLETLLSSFGWGYFWSLVTAAYLLLRQSVDGTELDEVVLDEPGEAG